MENKIAAFDGGKVDGNAGCKYTADYGVRRTGGVTKQHRQAARVMAGLFYVFGNDARRRARQLFYASSIVEYFRGFWEE